MALSYRKIKIGKADGTDWIELKADSITNPDPYPEFNFESMNKSYQMRRNASGPGRKVWKSPGTDINHSNIEINAPKINDTDQGKLKAMKQAVPNVVLLSIDDETTKYFAIFKDGDSLTFEPYKNNEDMFNKQAYFVRARIKLAVLNTSTTSFEEIP